MENTRIVKLLKYMKDGNTLLGIGPMSVNAVNAAIEISNETDFPIMLISSRRQIDDKNISRGYVNNWSTDEFASYVRKKSDNVILARDHGGPWQNNIEISRRLSINDALKSAKDSFASDIDAGFDILHIDPSIDIFEQLSFEKIFDRLTDLYEFCSNYAKTSCKNIEFEIGTEEQMIHINSLHEFNSMLNIISDFCIQNNFKIPLFVVSQIGTKVMETKNIGILNQKENIEMFNKITKLCNCASNKGIFVKVHNTDYLNAELLKKFPSFKIGAANVAPEFGVRETKSFIELLEKHYLIELENEFLECAYNSKKWEKWLIQGSNASNREKAIMAGHYIFSDVNFLNIKEKAQRLIKNVEIDEYLKNCVKKSILSYINIFQKKESLINA